MIKLKCFKHYAVNTLSAQHLYSSVDHFEMLHALLFLSGYNSHIDFHFFASFFNLNTHFKTRSMIVCIAKYKN